MTSELRHFARTIHYDELIAGLRAAQADHAVYCKTDASGLELWNYTQACTYNKRWTPFSLVARGLILDPASRSVVATPFPKFFNLGENGEGMPDEPFEVYEKLDGSLIILFHHQDRWRAVTRGTFGSAQALWAERIMATADLAHLAPGTTTWPRRSTPRTASSSPTTRTRWCCSRPATPRASSCRSPSSPRPAMRSAGGPPSATRSLRPTR